MPTSPNTRSSRGLLLEGMVIVVSILLAFSLEAWWDARGERLEEALVLENLLAEFRGAAEELDTYLSYDRRIEAAVVLTLERVREGKRSGRSGLLRGSELRRALAGWPGILEEAAEEGRGSMDSVRNHLDPVFWTHMDVSGFRGLASEIDKDEPDPTLLSGSTQVPVHDAVLGVLASRHQILYHQIEDLEEVRAEVDRIIVLLEEAVSGS
jgi:hypothetical protein